MRTLLAALLAVLAGPAFAAPVPPVGCPTCILNTAAPQNAQINIGTATIRGTLTVSTLSVTNLSIVTLTATNLIGSGAGITALNASALASGTIPTGRVAGAYTGITSVGTLTAGVWNGTAIAPQYGGTGQNWSAVNVGALPYFSATGVMSTLAAGASTRLLQANGAGAPSWTAAPTVLGTNVTAIPLANLVTGNLPSAIKATDASLVSVSGSKVSGDITGNAENINGDLPVSQLAAGTLPADVVAQTLNTVNSNVGTFGGSSFYSQFTVNAQGRITAASQGALTVDPDQINAGDLPSDVLVPAANVKAGTLGPTVIASSVAASGVTAGSFGAANRTLTATVGVDGRLSALAQTNIALPTTQINSGALPAGVTLPAAQVTAGTLPSGVIAQTLAASGVTAGTYGSATRTVQIAINAEGRITSAVQVVIPGISTSAAWTDRFNDWTYPQTSQSSWTIKNDLKANTITAATMFSGPGTGISSLTPASLVAGTIPADVIASSVAANKVGPVQLVDTAVTAGSYGSTSKAVSLTVDADGRLTAASAATIAISTGEVSGIVQPAKGGTGQDWSAVTVGRLPYFSGTGAMTTLAAGTNGYTLVQSGGVPAWAAAASSATNIAGGAVGSLPYQSAANTTLFLPAMGAAGIVIGNGTSAIPSTATLTGTANQVIVTQSASAVTLSLPQSINSGAAPTFTGTNLSGIPAGTALTGQLPVANGGTALSSAGGTANRVLRTSDGSAFVVGQVIGPDIAPSTVPLSALNQSGAAANNVIAWNGSAWAATSPSSMRLSTATSTAGPNSLVPSESSVTYHVGDFTLTDNPTANATFVQLNHGTSEYTTSGSFATPPGVSTVTVLIVGGGGGGGGSINTTDGAGAGGGGAGEALLCRNVTVSGTVTVTVSTGALGGTTGASPTAGTNANSTSFGSLVAHGGLGGARNSSNTGGAGGAGGGTFYNLTGGAAGTTGLNSISGFSLGVGVSSNCVVIAGASGGGGGSGGGVGGPGGYSGMGKGGAGGPTGGAAYAGGGGGGGGGYDGNGGVGSDYGTPVAGGNGAGKGSGGGGGNTGNASGNGAAGYVKVIW